MTDDLKHQMGNRIKAIRNALNLSQKDFAETLKIYTSFISEVEKGKRIPGGQILHDLILKHNLNIEYLFFGVGEIFSNKIKTQNRTIDIDWELETIDDVLWLAKLSNLFKTHVMGFATKFFLENEALIKRDLKKKRKKQEVRQK
jgi:transcriptional regulator with XRE-family HTH domain